MDLVKVDKLLNRAYSRHPFLRNFPFLDFAVEAEELSSPVMEIIDAASGLDKPLVVNFLYTNGKRKTSISVFDRELSWLNSRADYISEIDSIVEVVNAGLASEDILDRRDAVQIGEAWIKAISDNRTALNYSTFNDILMRLIGASQLRETVELINNINKLANGSKIIRLDKKQHDIIMTYYEFQLIYCKLILGIVISAKISL